VTGSRSTSTASLTPGVYKSALIEDDALLFAVNVNMTDGFRGRERTDKPYQYQLACHSCRRNLSRSGGCWAGQNAVILLDVTSGEMSIVGCNSVVNCDVPARCMAVGAPCGYQESGKPAPASGLRRPKAVQRMSWGRIRGASMSSPNRIALALILLNPFVLA